MWRVARLAGLLMVAVLLTGGGRLSGSAAVAVSLTVVPTRVVLEGDRRTASLVVRNGGSAPVLVRVETLRWIQAVPSIATEPDRELIAVPPVFRLPPGGEQTIRIGLRHLPPLEREQTYRLLVSEVPTEEPKPRGGVQLALRFSIPVFVQPAGVAPRLEAALSRERDRLAVVLHNRGSAHARVNRLRIARAGRGDRLGEADPGYLLAGESRVVELSEPLPVGTVLEVEVETEGGTRSFELVVADG